MTDTRPMAPAHDIPEDVLERRWAILALLCTSLMIVIIGNTSLNVALPRLAEDLSASISQLQWMVDAYSLVFAGMLLTAGALGDRFGRKGALQFGLALFGIGAVLAALSSGSGQLVAARALMGFAAAFVMPSTLSILTNVFPPHERAKAIAVWAGISGGGAALGPIASGFLLEHFWWGSVFLVNLPIIAVALVVGRALLPKSSDPAHAPLDPIGAGLSIVGLAALVYAIIEAPNHGWASVTTLAWMGGAIVAIAAFLLWEKSARNPMLDLDFFRDRRFSVSSFGITLTFFAMFGTVFLLSQYFQLVLGYTPLGSGVRLLPMSFVLLLVAPQSPKLVTHFGANRVAGTGLVLVSVGLGLFSLTGVDTAYLQLAVSLMVLACGMALTMSPMTAQLMSSVPMAKAGVGSAMNDTTRELGGALGVAVLGSLVTSRYSSSLEPLLSTLAAPARAIARSGLAGAISLADNPGRYPGLAIDVPTATAVKEAAQQAFVDGLGIAATVGSAVVMLAAITVFRLLPSDRRRQDVADPAPGGHGPNGQAGGVDTNSRFRPAQGTDGHADPRPASTVVAD